MSENSVIDETRHPQLSARIGLITVAAVRYRRAYQATLASGAVAEEVDLELKRSWDDLRDTLEDFATVQV